MSKPTTLHTYLSVDRKRLGANLLDQRAINRGDLKGHLDAVCGSLQGDADLRGRGALLEVGDVHVGPGDAEVEGKVPDPPRLEIIQVGLYPLPAQVLQHQSTRDAL